MAVVAPRALRPRRVPSMGDGLPPDPPAPPARHPRAARAGPRDAAASRRPGAARCSSRTASTGASRSRRCRASTGCRSPTRSPRPARRRRSGFPPCCCSACRPQKDELRQRRLGRRGDRPARHPGDQGGPSGPAGDHRRVPVRVHQPRPLWRRPRPTAASTTTRSLELLARTAVSQARAGADLIAPERHDGRPRRRDPHRARRRRLHRHPDPRLLGEVRLRVLRPVPRGGRLGPGLRRPPRLSDGPGQRRARRCARRRSTSRRAPTS